MTILGRGFLDCYFSFEYNVPVQHMIKGGNPAALCHLMSSYVQYIKSEVCHLSFLLKISRYLT